MKLNLLLKNKGFAIFLMAIPIICFIFLIDKYTVNAPILDDFYWTFKFMNDYLALDSIPSRIDLLVSQHNQHRIFTTRLFISSYYHLFNEIDIRKYILIGNVLNLGIFLIILLKAVRFRNLLIGVPISFWWFQLQYFPNTFNSAVIPNMSVLFFAFASFYIVSSNNLNLKNLLLASILAVLSMFSNGNGFLCFPIIIFILIYRQERKFLLYFTIITFLSFFLYFYRFRFDSSEIKIEFGSFIYFLKFLGISFFPGHNTISIAFSLSSFLFLLYYFISNLFETTRMKTSRFWFYLAIFAFVIGSALLTTAIRYIHNLPIADWYRNYSILFIIIVFLVGLEIPKIKRIDYLFFLVMGVFIWASTTLSYLPVLYSQASAKEAEQMNFQNYAKWTSVPPQFGLVEIEKLNDYSKTLVEKNLIKIELNKQVLIPNFENEVIEIKQDKINNENWKSFSYEDKSKVLNGSAKVYSFLTNNKDFYYFGTFKNLNKKNWLKSGFFSNDIFFLILNNFPASIIPEGEYQLGIMKIDSKGNKKYYLSNQSIKINNFENEIN